MKSRQNMASNGLLVWFLVIYLSNGISWTIAYYSREARSPENVCTTDTCRHAAEQILNYMDKDVDPCDDFYNFTCGTFVRTATIPKNVFEFGAPIILWDLIKDQLHKILEEESPPNELRAFQLAKNLYKACTNNTHVEEKGLKPLLKFVKSLGGWPVLEGDNWAENNFSWTETVYKMNDEGFPENFFIEWTMAPHPENKTNQLLQVFPPLHYYLTAYGSNYYKGVIEHAVFLGADRHRAMEELEKAFKFEEDMEKISNSINSKVVHEMSIKNLTTSFPTIPWTEYYSRIQKIPQGVVVDENEKMLVKNVAYMEKFQELINSVPKKVQANYVMYRIVIDFFMRRGCLDFIPSNMFASVGYLYFQKYIKEDTKMEVNEMTENIKKQFRILIQKASWMDGETKKHALEKLDWMTSFIESGDQFWDDARIEEAYRDLELDAEDYFHSYLNLTRFALSPKSRGLNPLKGHLTSAIENEYSSTFNIIKRNSIILGAGVFQGSFFNNNRPKYMNYAAIGGLIGHEIAHGFDNKGRILDKTGKKIDWWADAETVKKYMMKSQCFVNQYGNYTVEEVGENLNGIRTLNENIADNAGFLTAYLAYREWAGRNGPEPTLPGLSYNQNQMFWISAGHHWCRKYTKRHFIDTLADDPHAPSKFRVNGALSNMPEFANDFNCLIGSKMNPESQCSMW